MRRQLRCALPGFDETRWAEGATPLHFMGRLRVVNPDGTERDPDRPRERHDEGCPGSWYRSEFVDSLAKYERILTDAGYSSNLLADRTDDRLVIEALQYIEHERVRARGHWNEVRLAAERKA